MAAESKLFRHAISPPAFRPEHIHRSRLVQALHDKLPRKLILITAPAGYGKTMLLADFHAHTQFPTCWVRFSEPDTDVMRLASVLRLSLRTRFRRLKDRLSPEALSDLSPVAVGRMFGAVIEQEIKEPFVLILDDNHLLEDSDTVPPFFEALLDSLPSRVSVLMAGRDAPEFSLVHLIARDEISALTAQDLALDQAEVKALLERRWKQEVELEDVRQVLAESEGWVTGVLLSERLHASDSPPILRTSQPMVFDYLAGEVFGVQSEAMQEFFLRSSVLPIMTPEVCDEVLEASDSGRHLEQALAEGLFISVTSEALETFEYHPLFRAFLLSRLEKTEPERVAGLQERAAAALERAGLHEHAFDLYLECGQVAEAERVADREVGSLLLEERIPTLRRWLVRLQDNNRRPSSVLLHSAISHLNEGHFNESRIQLRDAREALKSGGRNELALRIELLEAEIEIALGNYEEASAIAESLAPRLGQYEGSRFEALFLRVRGLIFLGMNMKLEDSEILLKESVRILEKIGNRYQLCHHLQDLSRILDALGKHVEADAACEEAFEIATELGSPLAIGVALNNMALTAFRRGEFSIALKLVDQSIRAHRNANAPLREAISLVTRAEMRSDLGEAANAISDLSAAIPVLESLGSRPHLLHARIQLARTYRRVGNPVLALQLLREIDLGRLDTKGPIAGLQLEWASINLPQKPEESIRLLEESITQQFLVAEDESIVLLHLARSFYYRGERDKAVERLVECISHAVPTGTLQAVAAEVFWDRRFYDWMIDNLSVASEIGEIATRVELINENAEWRTRAMVRKQSKSRSVRLLGLGGAQVIDVSGTDIHVPPIPREVLFILVDAGRLSREQLVGEFWPKQPATKQASNLHATIYNLRKILGRRSIIFDGDAYRVGDDIRLYYDVQDFEYSFEALLASSAPSIQFDRTIEVARLYGGAFLPNSSSQWVVVRRQELAEKFALLILQLVRGSITDLDRQESLNLIKEALKFDPYREDLNIAYLQTLGKLGHVNRLSMHYRNYCRLLQEDLGLDPSKSIARHYVEILESARQDTWIEVI